MLSKRYKYSRILYIILSTYGYYTVHILLSVNVAEGRSMSYNRVVNNWKPRLTHCLDRISKYLRLNVACTLCPTIEGFVWRVKGFVYSTIIVVQKDQDSMRWRQRVTTRRGGHASEPLGYLWAWIQTASGLLFSMI